jgi:hypothetical protein
MKQYIKKSINLHLFVAICYETLLSKKADGADLKLATEKACSGKLKKLAMAN